MYEIEYLDLELKDEEKIKYEEIIKKVLEECFKEEKLNDTKLYIEITLTTPKQIKRTNSQFRNIDKETDVLSFPMFEKEEIAEGLKENKFNQEDALGNIIISIERVEEQAKEYGHSFERELSYMIVHGFYHLMGYDHIDKEDKIKMRKKEEKILTILKITRE